jgi:hypothetical protein
MATILAAHPWRVYIAGPYTQGDVAVNVRTALEAASRLLDAGLIPYVPHLTHFWHLLAPRPYEDWLAYDQHWLACCAVVLRLPGASAGAEAEVRQAQALGRPVYTSLEALVQAAHAAPAAPGPGPVD